MRQPAHSSQRKESYLPQWAAHNHGVASGNFLTCYGLRFVEQRPVDQSGTWGGLILGDNARTPYLAACDAVAAAPLMDWIMSPSSGQAIIGWGQYECILHSGRSVSMSHYLTAAPSPTKGSCKSNLVQGSCAAGVDVSCSTFLPKSPDRIAQPHSRSGRAHALETLSLIAAHNRCASGVRAALPSYPFPRLTLTSGMSQFGPASGSLKETRGHIMTVACKRGLSVYLSHFPPPETQKPRRFRQGLFIHHAAT